MITTKKQTIELMVKEKKRLKREKINFCYRAMNIFLFFTISEIIIFTRTFSGIRLEWLWKSEGRARDMKIMGNDLYKIGKMGKRMMMMRQKKKEEEEKGVEKTKKKREKKKKKRKQKRKRKSRRKRRKGKKGKGGKNDNKNERKEKM